MNASADQNFVRSKLAVLNTDGSTTIPIKINPINGGMKINTTDTISFIMTPISKEDENFKNVLLWQGTDGLLYPWVANSNGEVLVEF